MPPVGFKTKTPVFQQEKTVHALDRAATMFGIYVLQVLEFCPVKDLDSWKSAHLIVSPG
jgi:hypothetical protein